MYWVYVRSQYLMIPKGESVLSDSGLSAQALLTILDQSCGHGQFHSTVRYVLYAGLKAFRQTTFLPQGRGYVSISRDFWLLVDHASMVGSCSLDL